MSSEKLYYTENTNSFKP